MKIIYIRNSAGRLHQEFLDIEEKAWEKAFEDLRDKKGFPERIIAGGQIYERQDILGRYWESLMIKNPEPAREEFPVIENPGIVVSPFDRTWEKLPDTERQELTQKIIADMPEFLQERYRRQILYGDAKIEDIPTLFHLFNDIRDRLLSEKPEDRKSVV